MADDNAVNAQLDPAVNQLVAHAAQQVQTPALQQDRGMPQPRPILADLLGGLFGGQGRRGYQDMPAGQPAGTQARPVSRLNVFENFLGNFIQALGAGFANEGHGPGAAFRGAGAAVQAPYQQAVGRYQLGLEAQQSQADTQLKQAQTQQLQNVVQTPYGPMSAALAAKVFPAAIQAQGRVDAAKEGAGAKLSVAQMQLQAATGQVSRIIPVEDENGNMVMRALNKYGQPIGDIDGAIPPASYLPKSSSTVEYKQQADGSYVALPKTTTSSPRIPGKATMLPAHGGASRIPRPGGGGLQAQPVTMNGKPLMGLQTGTTRTMTETAPKVLELAARVRQEIADQQKALGPAASRWQEFFSGKAGSPNPGFTKLRTDAGLLQTLLMRMHVGARGGEQMMAHFRDLFDISKQSPENLNAALDEIVAYANDVKNSPNGGSAATVQSLVGKYK